MPRAHRSRGLQGVLATLLLVGCAAAPAATTSPPPSASPSVTPLPLPSSTASPSPAPTPPSTEPPTAMATPTANPSKPAGPTGTPFTLTTGEQFMLDTYFGVGDCSPMRAELPRNVNEAIECVVDDGLVDRVGLYGEELAPREGPEDEGLYVDRMAEYGIALQSGDCAAGIPGDSSWLPIDPPSAEAFFRIGCFVNENNHANVRLTCPIPLPFDVTPTPHLYIGVLGQTADVAALYEWTMGDEEWREHMASTQRDHPNGPMEERAKPAICTPGFFER